MKIDNERISETGWGSVDKAALGTRLAEMYAAGEVTPEQIREVYAFVPDDAFTEDGEGRPVFRAAQGWGPHHVLDGDTLVVNRGGVQAAAGALAGARAEPSLSEMDRGSARRHIRRHYRALRMEAPESLREARFTELCESAVELAEAEAGRPRRIRATGITADVINRNGRRYPGWVLRAAVEDLRGHLHESAGQGRLKLLGEVEHPSDKGSGRPNLLETVVRWDDVQFDGRQVLLGGVLLETSKGKDLLALLEGGVRPGISQRGWGRSRNVEEGDQRVEEVLSLTITGYDMVMEPSDPEAQVTMLESDAGTRGRGDAEGDEEMDPEQLMEMIKGHPELFKGVVAESVQEMSDAQRRALEESVRTALGVDENADLALALAEAATAKRELAERKRLVAIDAAIAEACKGLPYGDALNKLFAESLRAAAPADAESVRRLAEAKRKEYDAMVAAARLAGMGRGGVQFLGPVIEAETGVPEFARGAHEFQESMIRRGVAQRRDLRKPRTVNEEFAAGVLARFDECFQAPLAREARLLQEMDSSDLSLPYSASRAILAEVWPTLLVTSIFDVGVTSQSPTRVYYEDYAAVSGEHNAISAEDWTTSHDAWVSLAHKMIEPGTVVVKTTGNGGTYVEGTDYVVDYLDGKIMALSTGRLTDKTEYHVSYHADYVREGENAAIQRGKMTLAYATLDCQANRLATQITNEAVVFSRSQLGWDATARTLAGLVAELRRQIDAALMFNALNQALKTGSNSGGTWTAATDPLIDLVSYIGGAKVKVEKRHYAPTFILLSNTNSDILGNWDGFTAAGSRPDSELNANGYVGRVKGLPVFSSTEFSDAYALVGNREIVGYRVYQPMVLKGPFPAYSSTNLVAADQWYAEQYDGWACPIAGKASYCKIA